MLRHLAVIHGGWWYIQDRRLSSCALVLYLLLLRILKLQLKTIEHHNFSQTTLTNRATSLTHTTRHASFHQHNYEPGLVNSGFTKILQYAELSKLEPEYYFRQGLLALL